MITIPVVILGILIQKHLVKGFSFGTIRKWHGRKGEEADVARI